MRAIIPMLLRRAWLVVGLALLVVAPATARAQMADALGKPLPRADLPAGTVTVRVVAGELTKPVTSADVRLHVDGEVRTAVTNAEGRATFTGVPAGATIKAAVDAPAEAGASGAGEVTSEQFPLPAQGGVSLLLSTLPFKDGGAGGAPPMAAGGRPPPRMMAGQPRPERGDPPGRVTVRLSYNDWDATAGLADRPVVMVAYAADGRVAAKVVETDAGGRAVFDALDTTGATAYYALALLPRDGGEDRLMSLPITPSHEAGMRIALSGEKQGSGAPPVDDMERFAPQPALAPGQVLLVFAGNLPPRGTNVELIDAATGEVAATTKVDRGRPLPSSIDAQFGAVTPKDGLAAGAVEVAIQVQGLGLPRVPVLVRAVEAAADGKRFETAGTTDDQGRLVLTGAPVGVPLEVALTVEGRPFTSAPFTLEAGRGSAVDVTVKFELLSALEAMFEGVTGAPDRAYFAQLVVDGEPYRSPPFLVPSSRGVVAPVFVLPRVSLTFQLDAYVDDEYLATRGTWILQNAAWAPWTGPSEGLKIPAPAGATGLVVADEDKAWVSADGDVFRLLKPVPPLGGQFRAGFSVPIDAGELRWDMPLPLGATRSSIAIRRTKKMTIELPPGVDGRDVPQPNGSTWHAVTGIEIPPNQRMVFALGGLPQRPAWQRISKWATGAGGLLLIGAGLWFALARRTPVPVDGAAAGSSSASTSASARKKRRRRIDELLEQVAAIDRARRGDADAEQRAALVAELEALYREEEAAARPARGG